MSGQHTKESKSNASGEKLITPMPVGFQQYNPMPMMAWWFWFAAASYLLSLVFQTFKVFTLETTLENTGWMVLAVFALFLVMAYLSFDSYAKERRQGKIYHPVGLFEWLYQSFFRNNLETVLENDLEKGVVS